MKNKSLNLIFGLLMIAALLGGLALVKKNQDSRKGAYFAGTKLFLQSAEIQGTVGSQVPVQLWLETDGGAKVSSADITVCYDTSLNLNSNELDKKIVLNNDVLQELIVKEMPNHLDVVGAKQCLRMVAIASPATKPEDLKSGMVKLLTINFTAANEGSGEILIQKESAKIGGYNPAAGATDTALKVNTATGATFTISGANECRNLWWFDNSTTVCAQKEFCGRYMYEGLRTFETKEECEANLPPLHNCDRCSTVFNNMRVKYSASDCLAPVDDTKVAITRTYDATCQEGKEPLQCQRCSRINDQEYTWWKRFADKTCTDSSIDNETQPVYRAYNEKCSLYCDNNSDCPSGYECIQPPTPTCGGKNTNCLDVMPRKICVPITSPTPTIDVCKVTSNRPIGCVCTSNAQCASKYCNPTSKKCAVKPIATPTQGEISEWPVLNYRVQYAFVKTNDSKCFVPEDWPLQMIVLGGGVTKVYSNIIPKTMEDSGDFVKLEGSLVLEGFNLTNNVAVFMKGSKHLQMKYAVKDQENRYKRAGGELVLTRSIATSPIYDFTKYPALPGDVRGKESDNPDGVVDGFDYVEIKNRAKVHETVEDGMYLKSDLDGSCQVNSNDIQIIRKTLEEKQGELY